MAKLLKFSCKNCGAKLAVPLHMAGLTDHCPKCGSLVTSPDAPAAEPPPELSLKEALPPLPAVEAWSSAELADALRPETSREEPPQSKSQDHGPAHQEETAPVAEPPAPPVAPVTESPRMEAPSTEMEEATQDHGPLLPLDPEPKTEVPVPQPQADAEAEAEADAADEAEIVEEEPQEDLLLQESELQPEPAPELKSKAPVSEQAPEPEPAPVSAAAVEPPAPAVPSHGILSSILGNPLVSVKNTSSSVVSRHQKFAIEPVPPPSPRNALQPTHASDEEVEAAAAPGMGEVLAAHHASTIAATSPQASSAEPKPWHTVPFLPVASSTKRTKKLKRRRFSVAGVVIFLLVDLLIIGWLLGWWSGPGKKVTVIPPATLPVKTQPVTSDAPVADDTTEPGSPTASTTPSPDSPALTAPTSPSREIVEPSISAPSDFAVMQQPGPSSLASVKPVPLAIPILSDAAPAPLPDVADLPAVKAPDMAPAPLPELPTTPPSLTTPEPAAPAASVVASLPSNPAAPPIPPIPTPAAPELSPAPLPPPSTPPAPPPLPEADKSTAALGGLPPPPADMAFPNGPPPADVQALVNAANNPAPSPPRISAGPKEAKSALDALVKFLDAPSYKERMAHTSGTPALQAAMEKHAAAAGDGPIHVGSIEFVERYTNKDGVPPYCMFEVGGGSLSHSVLVLVEQPVKGQSKVDWEAFMEFKDDLLLKFLETKTAPPQKFRVMMRRKHYFDKDVPNISSKDGFELKQPNADFEGHVFVPRDSALARQLANQLGWGMDMPVIAELTWKTQGNSSWVEIKSIPSYGWRG